MDTQQSIGRTSDGRFAPGCSGNPAGRPRGSRNKATIIAASLVGDTAQAVVTCLINRALEGDLGAQRFIVGRILPAMRMRAGSRCARRRRRARNRPIRSASGGHGRSTSVSRRCAASPATTTTSL